MGRDKSALPFGSETALERVVRVLRDVTRDVVLVGRPATAVSSGLRVIGDPGAGPLAALGVGLREVVTGRALLVACDMPFLSSEVLRFLLDQQGEHDACVPRPADVALPTCAVYARRADRIVQSLVDDGERSLRALLDRLTVRWVEDSELRAIDPELQSFMDCDTPEDYARALKIARLG
jgi:molybdopterin-guanine dinucleotide biosynthesis protein A